MPTLIQSCCRIASALIIAAAMVAAGHAAPTYTITDLGTLGGDTRGNAINDFGQIAGTTNAPGPQAYFWDGGPMVSIGSLGGPGSLAFGINNSGWVTGAASNADFQSRAFIWDGTNMQDLGVLPTGTFSFGWGINDAGWVAGYSNLNESSDHRAFVWDGTSMLDLGTPDESEAYDVNSSGRAVGWSLDADTGFRVAFIWDAANGPTTLADPFETSEAYAINDSGQVTGYIGSQPVIWSGAGTTYLAASGSGWGLDINNDGHVVGVLDGHAFVWDGAALYDLNQQLVDGTGWLLTEARGISDHGEITGTGSFGDDGVQRAFLLTPVSTDTTPPVVNCSVTPSVLSPPNHKLVSVVAAVNVADTGSGPSGFTLVSVTSNEPDAGLDSTDIPNDIQGWEPGTADVEGQLRAERFNAATGRVYTLTYRGMDAAGNSAECKSTVTVPRNSKK